MKRLLFISLIAGCAVQSNVQGVQRSACVVDDGGAPDAAAPPTASRAWVLDFDGHNGAPHVNHGYFWPHDGSQLGSFFLQAWVMPRQAGARYWLSAGYGGAHEILAGFDQVGGDNYTYGGWSNGTDVCYAMGATPIPPGTWVHVAVGWDGTNLHWYVNGKPDAKLACPNTRRAVSLSGGGGELFIGGSTHNTFDGRIAEVEIWENFNPLSQPDSPFMFEHRFSPSAWDGAGTATPASFLAFYTSLADGIADLSPVGYLGRFHPGVLYAAADGEDRGFGFGQGTALLIPDPPGGPLPTWVLDPNAPTAQ